MVMLVGGFEKHCLFHRRYARLIVFVIRDCVIAQPENDDRGVQMRGKSHHWKNSLILIDLSDFPSRVQTAIVNLKFRPVRMLIMAKL
tara:strand:- start:292 stop:552 length:261 start_codon:yes stop_codon:yes gene_type:complete